MGLGSSQVSPTLMIKMGLNLDVMEIIGSHCDDQTMVNLCLADREYYLAARPLIEKKTVNHFVFVVGKMISGVQQNPTKLGKLRKVHTLYRYLIDNKHALTLASYRSPRIRLVVLKKLDEFVLSGMCRRRANKYKKQLSV